MLILQTMATEYRRRLDEKALDGLMGRIVEGDRDALAELYHRARTTVYALALSYLKNTEDAEDVTQDAFVQIWDNALGYRAEGKTVAWILTIARNLCLMRLRKQQRSGELSEEEWAVLPALPAGLSHEEQLALRAALELLDAEERRIVLLHAVTGWKHREIASLLELPLPTVLSKYHRALTKLRKQLEGENVQ